MVHLKNMFPNETDVDEAFLRRRIQGGMENAEQFGIVIEADIARFLEYSFYYHQKFYNAPDLEWIQDILQDEGLDGTQKMDKIDSHLRLSTAT